jgi:hypothetical protein
MPWSRMENWSYNGLLGPIAMAVRAMQSVMDHPAASETAKDLAQSIQISLWELSKELRANKVKKK